MANLNTEKMETKWEDKYDDATDTVSNEFDVHLSLMKMGASGWMLLNHRTKHKDGSITLHYFREKDYDLIWNETWFDKLINYIFKK